MELSAIIILGLAAGLAAYTFSTSRPTEPIRNLILHLALYGGVRFATLVDQLIGCPYCLSHYTAALLLLYYGNLALLPWLASVAVAHIFLKLMQSYPREIPDALGE